jgi:hypothetical protein
VISASRPISRCRAAGTTETCLTRPGVPIFNVLPRQGSLHVNITQHAI